MNRQPAQTDRAWASAWSWQNPLFGGSDEGSRIRSLTASSTLRRSRSTILRGVECDRGHRDLLAKPMDVMCRRSHRNARRIGAASHRRDIRDPGETLEFRIFPLKYDAEGV